MKFTPRPYQHIGIQHILDVPRCAVWAGMGMGKGIMTLTALDTLYMCGTETRPALVLGPLRVARDVWRDEANKWDHLRHIEVQPVTGTTDERVGALSNTNASVFATNYEQLPWLVERLGERWPFGAVVADESTRLKSFRGGFRRHPKSGKVYYQGAGGQRARALGKVAFKCSRFIQLTGTPSPNGLKDLWGQLWFLDFGRRMGYSHGAFTQRWFRPASNGYGIEPLEHAEREIHAAVRDLCLTLDPKDWFDLHEPIVTNVHVDLPPTARAVYDDMEKLMFAEIGEHGVEAFNAAARTNKCLQIANGAAYVGDRAREWHEVHRAKLEALGSIAAEWDGTPLLVAYQFRSDLARLQKAFPTGRDISTPDGLAAFKAGCVPMGFAHPASMGHGIDGLQYATNVLVFFGHNWNLEERLQITERIGPVRQAQAGFKRATWIYNIIARRTVDELVLERIEGKRSVQDILLAAMKRRKQ